MRCRRCWRATARPRRHCRPAQRTGPVTRRDGCERTAETSYGRVSRAENNRSCRPEPRRQEGGSDEPRRRARATASRRSSAADHLSRAAKMVRSPQCAQEGQRLTRQGNRTAPRCIAGIRPPRTPMPATEDVKVWPGHSRRALSERHTPREPSRSPRECEVRARSLDRKAIEGVEVGARSRRIPKRPTGLARCAVREARGILFRT